MANCCTLEQIERYVAGERLDPAVVEHLESCPTCQAGLERVRRNNAFIAEFGSTAVIPVTQAPPRETVEGFDILGEIHRGGQGIVYKAIQRKTHRTVALKVLAEGAFASPRQRRRFEREIELVAHLQHPNIVTLYESGETPDGRQYFAMEYVHGVPLDRHLAGKGGGKAVGAHLNDRLTLFRKICAGVSHAHQRGVTHRDLKPGNVLIDAEGEPHVVDFGLAKTPGGGGEAPMTMTGEFMGTLAYAAPEQLRGDPALIDTRTDVYALGVILYEMLTGARPHPSEGSMMEVLKAITDADPAPPSHSVAARRGDSGIDRVHEPINDEVDTIVLKALSKDRDRRYPTADALSADVERYLRGEPIDAKRDSSWYVLSKNLKRHRTPVAVVAVILVISVASAIATSVMYARAERERERADRHAEKSARVARFMEDMLSFGSAFNLPKMSSGNVSILDAVDYAAGRLEKGLTDDPLVRASLLAAIGSVYNDLGKLQTAAADLQEALDIRRRELGPDHPDVADALLRLGRMYNWAQDGAAAATALREALGIYRGMDDPPPGAVADVLLDLAMAEANREMMTREAPDFEAATALAGEALDLYRAQGDVAALHVVRALNTLGVLEETLGDLDPAGDHDRRARDHYEEALNICERSLDAGHLVLINCRNNVGLIRLSTGDADSGRRLLMRTLADVPAVLRDHPYIAIVHTNFAYALLKLGDFDEALRQLEAAVRIWDGLPDDASPYAVATYYSLGDVYVELGKLDRAESSLRQALQRNRALEGAREVSDERILILLAGVQRRLGRLNDAARTADEALSMAESDAGADPADFADALLARAAVAMGQGKPADAAKLLERAVQTWETLEPGGADQAAALVWWAASLAETGRAEGAEAALERVRQLVDADNDGDIAAVVACHVDLYEELLHARGHAELAGPLADLRRRSAGGNDE
ncbi:MAG: serine/threonine protein kinase [Phycisphaerales bacterium]|nr:MAG: serine/threonine protein kinase [Phycisphaerales bacterium]